MTVVTTLGKDFTASHIRHQISSLQKILDHIERTEKLEEGFIDGSIRRIENDLRHLRKFITE